MDPHETLMLWMSLYPHEIGDEILEDIYRKVENKKWNKNRGGNVK